MTTFQNVIKDCDGFTMPYVDDTMPEGIFGVTVKNVGGFQHYFFKGEVGDDQAPIVGRIQDLHNHTYYYRGGSTLGGTLVSNVEQIFKEN